MVTLRRKMLALAVVLTGPSLATAGGFVATSAVQVHLAGVACRAVNVGQFGSLSSPAVSVMVDLFVDGKLAKRVGPTTLAHGKTLEAFQTFDCRVNCPKSSTNSGEARCGFHVLGSGSIEAIRGSLSVERVGRDDEGALRIFTELVEPAR